MKGEHHLDRLYNWAHYLISMFLSVTVIVIGIQVFARYVLHFTFSWSEELARFLNVWITLIGSAIAVRSKSHISLDFLESFFQSRPRIQIILSIINAMARLLFFGLVMIASIDYIIYSAIGQTAPGLRVPMTIPYASLLLCGLLGLIFSAELFLKVLLEWRSRRI